MDFSESGRGDVAVVVTLKNDETVRGRFKWPLDISERQAVRTVLMQFTKSELADIGSVCLIPNVPLPWLREKRTYTA
jgi:hypothetical protein